MRQGADGWLEMLAALAAAVFLTLSTAGCGGTSSGDADQGGKGESPGSADGGRSANVLVDPIPHGAVDKVDLLLMIDNSTSMADKQETLAIAVPALINRFVNPACVDETGATASFPAGPGEPCPPNSTRELQPIMDIHVGVISSSLGDYGAQGLCTALTEEQQNDRGHLIAGRPRALGLGIAPSPEAPTSFLDWDLNANPGQDPNGFNAAFADLVRRVGEFGCGFEASLESWYRFLIDPSPYRDIQTEPCGGNNLNPCAVPVGVDEELLAQRAAFLRSDSVVAIIMVSDENDCSLQPRDQLYYPARQDVILPLASSVCAANPNDPCCYSCALGPPDGCVADSACANPQLDPALDAISLRCFKQKERFGIDFLFPVERYVNALSKRRLCPSRADLDPDECPSDTGIVPNPLYQDLSGEGRVLRDPALVYLAGIIGVPWQDIQAGTDLEGNPLPNDDLRFKTAEEMRVDGTWDIVLGRPEASPPVAPLDPLMIESILPRGGSNPVTGEALAPPSAGYLANSINGHEWAITRQDDLQYACIFPLPEGQRDCTQAAAMDDRIGCDCRDDPATEQKPLCQASDGSYSNIQRFAKAYPGLRQLRVLRSYGDNSIVASICARQLDNPSAGGFGYTPAVRAIFERLKDAFTGRCFARELSVVDGSVPCTVVEARRRRGGESGCQGLPGRRDLDPQLIVPTFKRLQELQRCGTRGAPVCDSSGWILCEITEAGEECLQREDAQETGWCYIDPSQGLGNPALVAHCNPSEKRLLRFVDPAGQTPATGAEVLIACGPE